MKSLDTFKEKLLEFGRSFGGLNSAISEVEREFSSVEIEKVDLESRVKVLKDDLERLGKEFFNKKTEFDKYFKVERDAIETEKARTRSLQVEAEENFKRSKVVFDDAVHKQEQWNEKIKEVEKVKLEHSEKLSKINKFMLDVK